MCKGRLCSTSLPERKRNKNRHGSNLFPSHLEHHFTTTLLPPCGDPRYCSLCKDQLTSHEKEKSGHILHQIMLLTAAQHAYNPAEQDDGYGHAYEAGSHPLEVCTGEVAAFVLVKFPRVKSTRLSLKGNSRSACHSSCLIVLVRLIGRFLGSADDE